MPCWPGPSATTRPPKIVFSKALQPPLTCANTTVIYKPVETAVPSLKALDDGTPMRTICSLSLVRSLFRLGLADRVRVMVFPTIRGATREEPVLADLPDLALHLTGTRVIDDRVVLLDYRVAGRPGDGGS
jgi:dihydrofolate reductase